ncbi:MAG: IS1634 family transposase, partial [bacterium]|nr:IS1634 family transposase [bacterium]
MRTTSQKRKDGSKLTHVQLVESVWDPEKKRSRPRVLYNCGRADDPKVVERLRRLAQSIRRRYSPEEIIETEGSWRLLDAWPYGDLYVLEALWDRLGIRAILERIAAGRRFKFSVERALFAMVANRTCAPQSKLYCWEQWLREDVRIDGTDTLELQHLYRAMDFLEANKDAIEREIFFSLSDLLNLDVELIFYDTTSLHFEVDQHDQGEGDEDSVRGSTAAGGKVYKAPRKRGHSKNGRGDVPQIVVGMAVTRDGFPVRHWVFPGNTVDVTTVERVKEDLRGWRLTRCVFVGDAGMVSEDNLKTLSGGGGKYIVCMPMRREKEVAGQVLG